MAVQEAKTLDGKGINFFLFSLKNSITLISILLGRIRVQICH